MKGMFSLPLYLQGIKRLKLFGLAVGAVTLVLSILAVDSALGYADVLIIRENEFLYGGYWLALLSPLLGYFAFSFLHRRPSSDFYHALPQKRSVLYISYTLALLTWIYGLLFVNLSVSSLGLFAFRCFDFDGEVFFGAIVSHGALALLFASLGVLAAVCTGTAVSALYTAAMLYILPVAVILIFKKMLFCFYPCVNEKIGILKLFDPEDSLYANPFIVKILPAALVFIVLGLGVLCLVVGGIKYVKRGSESAEKASASGVIRVFGYCALPLALTLLSAYYFVVSKDNEEGVTCFALAVASLFVYSLLSSFKVKTAIKSLLWMIPVTAVSLGVAGTAYFTGEVMRNNDPDSIYEIESLDITPPGYLKVGFYYPYAIENVKDEAVLTWVLEGIKKQTSKNLSYSDYTVVLRLKNGKTLNRLVTFTKVDPLEEYMKGIPEINKQINPLPKVASFRNEKQKELWEIFTEEYYTLPFETRVWLRNREVSKGRASFAVEVISNDATIITYVVDSKLTPNTYHFVVTNNMWEDIEW